VLSGILASYILIGFIVLTVVAVRNYYLNINDMFTKFDEDTGLPSDNQSEKIFMKWFLIGTVSMTLGMIIVLVIAHLSNQIFFLFVIMINI
jgi:hypothetical protein